MSVELVYVYNCCDCSFNPAPTVNECSFNPPPPHPPTICLMAGLWYIYSVFSRFHCDNMTIECTSYILENSTIIGCQQPYEDILKTRRFRTFYTTLVHGNNSFLQEHGNLKTKGILICALPHSYSLLLYLILREITIVCSMSLNMYCYSTSKHTYYNSVVTTLQH